MAAFYGKPTHGTMGWDYGQTYDSYDSVQGMSATNAVNFEQIKKQTVLLKRDYEVEKFIQRFRMGHADGELPPEGLEIVSCRPCSDRFASEYIMQDKLTGKTYAVYREERTMKDVSTRYMSVDNASTAMNYGVKLFDEMKRWTYGEWPEETRESNIKPRVCKSCKTSHPEEKLDLIGRCSVKLKSHNEKLRKLYWAHKNK